MSPVSSDEREKIALLRKQGTDNAEIARELKLPVTTVRAVAAWETMRENKALHQDQALAPEAEEVETALEATFGLERDLQNALRGNLHQLEQGLSVADGGKEHAVPSGRIDILAKDNKGTPVVIELKAGTADRDAIGQVLSYMGDLQANDDTHVKGIVIAGDFTPRAIAAARAAKISLRKYGFKFSFEQVLTTGQ
jgi:RecB family endonuclease NucS